MGVFGPGVWLGRLVVAALLVVGACSAQQHDDPFESYNPSDPFDDPFFESGVQGGGDSLDEFLAEPAPSVGWLSRDGEQRTEAHLLHRHMNPVWEDDPNSSDDDVDVTAKEKTFTEKAQEATLATMSVLVGAGMTALPFLIGT